MISHWCDDARQMARLAADRLDAVLAAKPRAAIALPTGHTPLPLYEELVRRSGAGSLRLDRVRVFNLDEYLGLGADDPLSYAAYLQRHLLQPARIPPAQVRLIRGDADDPQAECRAFDSAIEQAGGIDLAILGLGVNGHIAFNEPGSDWKAGTRVVALDAQTLATHRAQNAAQRALPDKGITMGIPAIRGAAAVLLLVAGASKHAALAALLRGVPDRRWPVTSLIGHPGLTLIADSGLRIPA